MRKCKKDSEILSTHKRFNSLFSCIGRPAEALKFLFVTTSRSFLRLLRLYQQIAKKLFSLKQPLKAEKKKLDVKRDSVKCGSGRRMADGGRRMADGGQQ